MSYKEYTSRNSLPSHCDKKKILFLKTHKTYSSTVFNILARYAKSRGFEVACPNTSFSHFSWPDFFYTKYMQNNTNPRVLISHMRYNSQILQKLFPKDDTLYLTILRNPVHQWMSIFLYFDFYHRYEINNKEDLINFIESGSVQKLYNLERDKYRTFNLLQNPTFFDLGYERCELSSKSLIEEQILKIENQFDIVLFADYFEESLLMLKETYCLNEEDILHFKHNQFLSTDAKRFFSYLDDDRLVSAIEHLNRADVMLYRRMLDKYKGKLELFKKDVKNLKIKNEKMYKKCILKEKADHVYSHVKILGYELKKHLTQNMKHRCTDMIRKEKDFIDYLCKSM